MLHAVGFWIEDLSDERQPAPQETVGNMPAGERQSLVTYLRSGRAHKSYLGYSWCRFGCGVDCSQMGSRDLTDGSWVWPEGLAHYVAQHEITLPEQFVRHSLSSAPIHRENGEPTDPDESLAENTPVSDALWIQWASMRRWPQVLEQLREARTRTAAFYNGKRIERIAQLEREHGLSSERCAWRDCPRNALAQMYVCAEHCSDGSARSAAGVRATEEFEAILAGLTGAHGQIADFRPPERPRRLKPLALWPPLRSIESDRIVSRLRSLFLGMFN